MITHTISNIIDLTNAPTPPRWFEFLLEPGRLSQHLETPGCEPSPTQLISLFFRNIPTLEFGNSNNSPRNPPTNVANTNGTTSQPLGLQNEEIKLNDGVDRIFNDCSEILIPPDSYEAQYRTKKTYALQTLAIKVASFLKWDLDIICNNLTIPVQYKLMQALNNACLSKNCPPDVKKFADILYYHWFLRSAITYQLSALQPQSNNTTIIYLSQLQQQQQAADSSALSSMGELFASSSKQLKHCSSELHEFIFNLAATKVNKTKAVKGVAHPFKKVSLNQPCMDCFDSRDEQFNDWSKYEAIDSKKFIEAACYDLGRFFFFDESYELAKHSFEIIKSSADVFPKLDEYLESSINMLSPQKNGYTANSDGSQHEPDEISDIRERTEKYLFDCMTEFSKSQNRAGDEDGDLDTKKYEDSDMRINTQQSAGADSNWYVQAPGLVQQPQLLEASRGDVSMSQGDFKQAMGCFVGALMIMTDYFRFFSKNYVDEEACITRMIQCSISLSCFTQAAALCQMSRNLNYTIAFKQLNEQVCNDCCDDIYECIWDVTLLEYIINLHSKRGELERRSKVIQLIGQLELNENNTDDILKEAEYVRRGRFFRIMSNKYL